MTWPYCLKACSNECHTLPSRFVPPFRKHLHRIGRRWLAKQARFNFSAKSVPKGISSGYLPISCTLQLLFFSTPPPWHHLPLSFNGILHMANAWAWNLRNNGTLNQGGIFLIQAKTSVLSNFSKNMDRLCQYTYMLFSHVVTSWYWQYDRSVGQLNWNSLKSALQDRFRVWFWGPMVWLWSAGSNSSKNATTRWNLWWVLWKNSENYGKAGKSDAGVRTDLTTSTWTTFLQSEDHS